MSIGSNERGSLILGHCFESLGRLSPLKDSSASAVDDQKILKYVLRFIRIGLQLLVGPIGHDLVQLGQDLLLPLLLGPRSFHSVHTEALPCLLREVEGVLNGKVVVKDVAVRGNERRSQLRATGKSPGTTKGLQKIGLPSKVGWVVTVDRELDTSGHKFGDGRFGDVLVHAQSDVA